MGFASVGKRKKCVFLTPFLLRTLQVVLDQDKARWTAATKAKNFTSPMPGDPSIFQELFPGRSFGIGERRYQWFIKTMVDALQKWRQTNSKIDLKTLMSGGYKK